MKILLTSLVLSVGFVGSAQAFAVMMPFDFHLTYPDDAIIIPVENPTPAPDRK